MESLKDIRTRLSSVISTRQITSAMKMVSAAKLRKAQDAIIRIRPYSDKLHDILKNLSGSLDTAEENIYADQREVNKVLIIVITSNRGLCGSFNANVVKRSMEIAGKDYADLYKRGNVDFIAVGKYGYNALRKKKYNVIGHYIELFDNLDFTNVSPVAGSIMQKFTDRNYDRILLVYNMFKNAAVQILTEEQFLPVKIEEEETSPHIHNYIFEPDMEYIVDVLIPKSLRIQFYKALLDSYASEHGARMTAMHMATENATELIRDLRLQYNKARQASITNEILEIVSGAEALRG